MAKEESIETILKRMEQIPVEIQRKVANQSLRAATVVLKKEAQDQLPLESGNLKEGVKIKKNKGKKTNPITSYRIGMDNSPYVFEDGKTSIKSKTTKSFYASMLHFGTKYADPVPFMTNAFEIKGDAALNEMKRQMKLKTERAIKKLSKGN